MSEPLRGSVTGAEGQDPLLDVLQSLSGRFEALARRLTETAVEPLRQGLPPDVSVLDECRAAAGEYAAAVSQAGVAAGTGIAAIVATLRERMTAGRWEIFLAAAAGQLADIGRLTHASSATPPYLTAVRERAAGLLGELRAAPPGSDPAVWEARVEPFRALWRLLTEADTLSDAAAEVALTQVEDTLGRAIVSAVITRKLVVSRHEHGGVEPVKTPFVQSLEVAHGPDDQANAQSPAPLGEIAGTLSDEPPDTASEPPSAGDGSPAAISQTIAGTATIPPVSPFPVLCEPVADEQTVHTPGNPLPAGAAEPVPTPGQTDTPATPAVPPPGVDGPTVRTAVWELLGANRCGLAYHIAACWAGLGLADPVEPSALFRAAALAPFVRSSFGEVVDEFRACVADLGQLAGSVGSADESAVARRLVLFGLSLRPVLLAPAAGAASVIQAVNTLDAAYPAVGRIRQAIAGFGAANVELSPSALKGAREQANWQADHQTLVQDADAWLKSNRMATIRYAPATEVWHRWLREDGVIGRAVGAVAADRRADRETVRLLLRDWRNRKWVEKQIAAADYELRKQGARRKPIEGPPVVELCDRVEEGVRLVDTWVAHIEAEPHVLDDYRKRRADEVRREVVAALPAAIAEVDRAAGVTALAAAAAFVGRSLGDLRRLFDPAQEESAEIPPVRILLGEELLAVPSLELREDWHPAGTADADQLHCLLARRSALYDPEAAFRTHAEQRNHARTDQVIEALHARGGPAGLIDRLRDDRGEQLRLCRKEFQRRLAVTRTNIEQAVCYDLIGGDDRSQYAETVEAYGAGLEDITDFSRAAADLQRIDTELAARQAARVALVRAKLEELTREVPADRQPDVEVIRSTLNRGDFLSAEEYLELVRSGQPLTGGADTGPKVIEKFFAGFSDQTGFVRQFDEFMTRQDRPSTRDVIDHIRKAESIGPIDMTEVSGEQHRRFEPQAKEAAGMVEAWHRLKDMKDRPAGVGRELTTLLAGFGFKAVTVESVSPAKPPHWLAACRTAEVHNPADCIVPQYGSKAHGKYRVLGVYDRPNEESLVELAKLPGDEPPVLVLYFGRMTEQRRRDLAEFSRARGRGFLTIDESLVYFLCGERFSRLPVLFQCALPFTVAKPYTTTASLVPVEMFFGRQREREQVTAIDGTNLVYGGRQLGKSALLRDIERRAHNPAAGQVVRWIDLKNRGIGIDHPTEDIWAEIGKVLHEEGVLASPATAHRTVADRVREWLRADEGRRILLLLDEADAFFEMDSQAPVKVTRQSYPEVARLKGLMDDTNRRFKVVFAGLHNVQRAARDPNTPLGHLGTPVCIGPLLDNGEWRQARDLIEVPLRHMGYQLTPPDLWMRVLSYTNYYPSLIQVFCKHLLEFLHNKDQTTFNFRECPPYPVTAEQVERVYQSKSLRDEVSHKFELTLGLDPRYRLIALEIALDGLNHPGGRAEGVDVAWVRTQALADWPNGFVQTDRGYELFRTILDEMVGLGILRRAGEDRYALRSPNVLNLLGSREQIESKLLDVMGLPQPQVYDAATFRRSLGGNRWDHSPFTAEQEATLTEPANGVAVVFASRLAGLDRLTDGLHGIPNLAGVQESGRMTQPTQFEAWLREVDEGRGQSEGVTLAVVLPSSTWTAGWVRRASDILSKKKGSRKRFLRVVFVADPSAGWSWLGEEEVRALGAAEITVRPWHETALRRWVEEVEFNDPNRVCEAIRTHLGGWYTLVGEFAAACRDNLPAWSAAIDAVRARWPGDPRWAGCCDIPAEAGEVLAVMAEFQDPIRPADLEDLAGAAAVRRALVWADRFAYIRRADDEGGERWAVDPVVRTYLAGGGR
ncbi:MAG: hypothetical protein U0792_05540 [Gemmataceae bacterium]